MALSDKEKADCILYLGWPGKTLLSTSTSYSKIVADRMESLPSALETQVRSYLKQIANIDDRLEAALCRLSTKQVDNVTLRDDEMYQLRKERKKRIQELSRLIDIPICFSDANIPVVV